MSVPTQESEIATFYAGSTVFVTGGTGFLGKLLVEKLLRTCKDVKKIYMLIRPKKGKETKERLEEMFSAPCFEPLKKECPNYQDKLTIFNGDIVLPDVGLNEHDKKTLMEEVDIIIHCAATVRFDEHIKRAVHLNVRSTRDLLRMAKQMKQLKAFVHVSTAYGFCPRKNIDEEVYIHKLSGENLLTACDALDDDTLEKITPTLLGDWPNTYVYTKAIAEEVVKTEGKGLPVAIVRPAIVISTAKEPVEGWIDSIYGATGILVGSCLGVIRSLRASPDSNAELVPADFVVNSIIASAWDVAKNRNSMTTLCEDPKQENVISKDTPIVYNYVASPENPITWAQYMSLAEKHAVKIPTTLVVWYPMFQMRPNRIHHAVAVFFLHTIPSYIVDFILTCIGKKPMLVKGYAKVAKFSDALSYFSLRQWNFTNNNVQALWKRMNPVDKELFTCSMKSLDWDSYFLTYAIGCRVYLLKDPLDTIPQGSKKVLKLKIAHYCLLALFYILMLRFCWYVCSNIIA